MKRLIWRAIVWWVRIQSEERPVHQHSLFQVSYFDWDARTNYRLTVMDILDAEGEPLYGRGVARLLKGRNV